MRDAIELRALKVAEHIVETRSTVREAAKLFRISKSTVHKEMGDRLLKLDGSLYLDVRQVLEFNKAERHLRGGIATREKYKHVEEMKTMAKK